VADNSVEIPNRAAFKASEVCEIAHIPPYVLRSWEKEFPGLGAAARPGGPRIYRRHDIEQILRIKQLVFAEGLTLSGARRRLEGDPPAEDEPFLLDAPAVPENVRTRVAQAKHDLRSLLDMLSQPAATDDAVGVARAAGAGAEARDALPLLDGLADSPPKSRQARRTGKDGPAGRASKVE
jgi:DNA-binding transcriptional MerR regulator